MAIKYLSGKRLQGTDAERTALNLAAPPATSWKELARGTLSSAADTINSGTFTAKDNIMILQHNINSSSVRTGLRLNADTGNNYAHRRSVNGAADATNVNHNRIVADTDVDGTDFTVSNFTNVSAQEKLGILDRVHQSGSGAGNAPDREEMVGKWTNTSSQITSVQSYNAESGDFDTGSEVVVLGYDNDEADSGNHFWQELASTELTSTATSISSGTFTAKKYLMFILTKEKTGGYVNPKIEFNSDTGNNYSSRYSDNGGSDNSSTSQPNIDLRAGELDGRSFSTGYIVNKSDQEKLMISHSTNAGSEGAGNASGRNEVVGKWTNTSSQITSINFSRTASGSFASGTILKVYGAD
jgi:hypothetical protein